MTYSLRPVLCEEHHLNLPVSTASRPADLAARGALPRFVRLARLVVVAMVVGLGISFVYWAVMTWLGQVCPAPGECQLPDAAAYWHAAMRLREGADLYVPGANVEASDIYRYAPWFAWVTVPVTYLPVEVAGALWSVILIAASTAAVLPFARRGEWLMAAFFWPILIGISANGNVQAVLVAALVLGVERRSGPLWIAMAASLKVVPILLVLVYVGRREWWRVVATLVATAALVAPMLLYDLSGYTSDVGYAGLLISWPAIYVLAVGALCLGTIGLARTRWAWLAGAAAMALALPRFFVYDVTFLLVGAVDPAVGARGAKTVAPGPS